MKFWVSLVLVFWLVLGWKAGGPAAAISYALLSFISGGLALLIATKVGGKNAMQIGLVSALVVPFILVFAYHALSDPFLGCEDDPCTIYLESVPASQ